MIDKNQISIRELKPGDHLCTIYETEDEHRALLTPFLRQGLEKNEKVIYIADARTSERILSYLREDGLCVEPFIKSAQLSILSIDEAYMRGGLFDPDGMIGLLESEAGRALKEGYSTLRVSGEMTWALRGLPGSERLIEYEAKLNDFSLKYKCLILCQYDRRRFAPDILLQVMNTHPIVVIGTEFFDNFYFLPPQNFIVSDKDRGEIIFNQWVKHLSRNKKMREDLVAANLQLMANEERLNAEIAGRVWAEGAMEETALEWSRTFNAIADLIFILDKNFTITRANKAFCDVMKMRHEDIVGKKCYELLHNRSTPWPGCPFGEVIIDGKPHTAEVSDSNIGMPLLVTVSPLLDDNGQVAGSVHYAKDITKFKKSEEEAVKHTKELEVFYDASFGREERILELKKEIERLRKELNEKR